MTRKKSTAPLRLPASIKDEAEKVAVPRTASYFNKRRGRADWEAFDRLINRPGGEAPCAGDELPA